MASLYNNPEGGSASSVGYQQRTNFFKRKAMIEEAPEIIFGQFSSTENQPKHMGKKIVMDHYLPILHDNNLTDQGIDANGVSTVMKVSIRIIGSGVVPSNAMHNMSMTDTYGTHYAVGEGVDAAAALVAAQLNAESVFKQLGIFDTDYATTVAALLALSEPWHITENPAQPATGNLYGSSKDVGYIQGKLPVLGETGGRVNRVGNTRKRLESEITECGLFQEYSRDSLDFDSDAQLDTHNHRELLRAAIVVAEDALQDDLLNGAGLIRYCGEALSSSEITGEGAVPSEVTYNDLTRLDIDLTNNGAPKTIAAITGSTNVDTRTVQDARVLIVGTEMIPTLKAMKDNFGDRAFKYVHEYASAGGKQMAGEIGALDSFRIVIAQRMHRWAGAGAPVLSNPGYRETNGNYDIYPMLAIAKGAFTEVGFRSSGTEGKWNIMHQKPGKETMGFDDPYGKIGRRSIQWWYGSMIKRPEHIGLIKTVARL